MVTGCPPNESTALSSKDFPLSQLATLPPPLPPPEIDPARLDPDALKVIARLKRHGFTAYLVGGCVRDLLLGAEPKDYDVATNAHPEEIRALFRNSRLIGRRFRLAHVFFGPDRIVEVATFRGDPLAQSEALPVETQEDGEAGADDDHAGSDTDSDARDQPNGSGNGKASASTPDDLFVTDDNQFGTAEEDARRRDFTVNGLFYEIEDGRVIDYVGGRDDLERRLVRTIGDPRVRMQEDPVRGMRAARIAAKLGLDIDHDTFDAMRQYADELPRCAPARVLEETLKILRTGASRPAFRLLRDAGILHVLLPPIEQVLLRGGKEAELAFYQRLGALDALIGEGLRPGDAVLLATLLSFLPLQDGELVPDRSAPLPTADRVLAEMSAHARLPRRVADRVRLTLSTQKVFLQSKKRGRRKSAGPVAAPHFPDALALFEIMVRATGEDAEALERWKSRAAQHAANKARREVEAAEAERESTEPARPTANRPARRTTAATATDADSSETGPGRTARRRRRKKPVRNGDDTAKVTAEQEKSAAPTDSGTVGSGNTGDTAPDAAKKRRRRRGGRGRSARTPEVVTTSGDGDAG